MSEALSKNGVPIRLTSERWLHITTGHPEMADYYYDILSTIEEPDVIYQGDQSARIGVKELPNTNKVVAVIYKETNNTDGFVITAYLTKKMQTFQTKKIIWKAQK